MKCIIVQLHTHKNAQYSLNECLAAVRAIGRYPEVEPEEENPTIVNLNFFTEDPRAFWAEFQQKILGHNLSFQCRKFLIKPILLFSKIFFIYQKKGFHLTNFTNV